MTDFAMPQALELEASRRNGIPAVRREVVHNTTTQNEYRPGELCYIPIDTGAAGAFMDTTTTRLEMTIVVRNKNYFVDFINLPRCGWNAIIQEFGVEINNGLHELNRHYAECIELDMIKRGENRTPYQICRSNPWRPAGGTAGDSHINFIKPSMVTSVALPHNVKYAPLTTATAATTPDILQYGMLLNSNPFTSFMFGRTLAGIISKDDVDDYIDYGANIGQFKTTNGDVSQSSWDDRIPGPSQSQIAIDNDGTFSAQYAMDGITEGSLANLNSANRIVGGPTYGTDVGNQAFTSPHDMYNLGGLNSYNVVYGQSVDGASPGQWPVFQPCPYHQLQKQIKEELRLVNADNIQNYYGNCKNIPIGIALDISSDQSGAISVYGDSVKSKPSFSNPEFGSETEFQVSLKVYSSLIGELTKKWFPELIVPQGRMRLRLRFQEPQIVFQTLMDPCRRVPGTSRDYLPYMGLAESSEITYVTTGTPPQTTQVITPKPISSATQCSVEQLASGIHPIMVRNYLPGMCYIPAVAMGKFPVPLARMKNILNLTKATDCYSYGTGGTDPNARFSSTHARYVVEEDLENQQSTVAEPHVLKFIDDIITRIDGGTELVLGNLVNFIVRQNYNQRVNQEIGYTWFYQPNHNVNAEGHVAIANTDTSTRIQDCQQLSLPPSYRTMMRLGAQATTGQAAFSTPRDTAGNEFWRSAAATLRDRPWKGQNWYNFCIPTPQYVPIVDPWNKMGSRVITADSYLNENQLCFGTHLEASVAQVRRSHSTLYPLQISDKISSRLDERVTYVVRNVQLVTQQIILPRTAAISIVENALNGGISMETIAWKEMESMLPKAESQKHLINMAAAFANSLTFLFRPIDTYQGDQAFGHNSFSFYNPFTVFYYEYDAQLTPPGATDTQRPDDYNYLGGKPVYYNECIVSTRVPFDIQLQLSSELYPRTPIDTIHRLLMHTRWGDQVFSNQDYMELAPCLQPSYLTQKGMVINTLQDGFWACYTPISALDDQTITCNPYFTPLELSLRKRIRGKRAPKNALPIYKPFDGTFHLSFNLEAFMGQSGRMRTGVPVVNNNMFLKMEKAHLIRTYDTQLLTICECDAKVVFERGGTMQFFT
jgi:hypothetical protein